MVANWIMVSASGQTSRILDMKALCQLFRVDAAPYGLGDLTALISIYIYNIIIISLAEVGILALAYLLRKSSKEPPKTVRAQNPRMRREDRLRKKQKLQERQDESVMEWDAFLKSSLTS